MHRRKSGNFAAAIRIAVGSAAFIVGCPGEELAPIEPCTVAAVEEDVTAQGVDEVDLLFMIDNSGSMAEEQALLAEQLPKLAQALASGVLDLGNGKVRMFTPVRSLHLGVISSDMGVNGVQGIKSCLERFGDDGKLLVGAAQSCALTTLEDGNHLTFTRGTTDPTVLGNEFACITGLGTSGCGLEQQLEAMLKAVAPASETSFGAGSGGHGDGFNARFLREKSVLALIAVTDEEDCSIPDSSSEMFVSQTTDPLYLAPNGKLVGINARCAAFAESGRLHPVTRYVEGFRALKDNPELLIFGAIAGVPEDVDSLLTADGTQDFDAILRLDKMQIKFDGTPGLTAENAEYVNDGNAQPDPACVSTVGAEPAGASPARRFVQVAKEFGKNGIIRSICAQNFGSAITAIIDKIANQLKGACLQRTLNPNEQGVVECDIVEYLPVGMDGCDPMKGRTPAEPPSRRDKEGVVRTVCKIGQVALDKSRSDCMTGTQDPTTCFAAGASASEKPVGWYYDDFTADVQMLCGGTASAQRIGFTPGAEPALGSLVQFECLQPVFTVSGEPRGKDTVNKQCEGAPFAMMSLDALAGKDGDSPECKSDEKYPVVRCEPASNTCQIMCEADSACPEAWVCDKVAPASRGFCVNPTCPNQKKSSPASI
jgi:hypothetical protein